MHVWFVELRYTGNGDISKEWNIHNFYATREVARRKVRAMTPSDCWEFRVRKYVPEKA